MSTWKGVRDHVHETNFNITEQRYVNLAPAIADKEDTCGIIFDCYRPCILRSEIQEWTYKFVWGVFLVGKQPYIRDGYDLFPIHLGDERSRDWVDWDVEQ